MLFFWCFHCNKFQSPCCWVNYLICRLSLFETNSQHNKLCVVFQHRIYRAFAWTLLTGLYSSRVCPAHFHTGPCKTVGSFSFPLYFLWQFANRVQVCSTSSNFSDLRLGFLLEWVKFRASTGPLLQVVKTIQNEEKRTIIMEKIGHTTIFQARVSLLLY